MYEYILSNLCIKTDLPENSPPDSQTLRKDLIVKHVYVNEFQSFVNRALVHAHSQLALLHAMNYGYANCVSRNTLEYSGLLLSQKKTKAICLTIQIIF